MADLIAYTDLASYLGVTFSAGEQTTATLCCTAASDLIKDTCNRQFEIQGNAVARYFTYRPPAGSALYSSWYYYPWPAVYPFTAMNLTLPVPILEVDDYFLSGQTMAGITITDYTTSAAYTSATNRGYPFNADSKGNPFTGIAFAAGTGLPSAEAGLVVTAKWGYVTSIPQGVKAAALLQASRFFKRKDAPFGVAGTDNMGNAMRLLAKLDPDVEEMLTSYRRWYAAA